MKMHEITSSNLTHLDALNVSLILTISKSDEHNNIFIIYYKT